MLSLQEISDRMEISELLVRYSHVIDSGAWDELAGVFTADAVIDYTEMGGPRGGVAETAAFLQSVMPRFASYQHLVGNTVLSIDGDTATARSICFNPMVTARGDGVDHGFFCGLWYRDALVRTDGGWRIRERYEERSYILDPGAPAAPGERP